MRSFAVIHQFMRSNEFKKLLKTPDRKIHSNGLMEMANTQLQDIDSASRRVYCRFYLSWDTILSEAYVQSTLKKGWSDVNFCPFDQEGILSNCPSYAINLSEEQKSQVAFLMPNLIEKVIKSGVGYATDTQIYNTLGEIIGRPNRDKNTETKTVRQLETMNIGRGRAGFFTAPGMQKSLDDRAKYQMEVEDAKIRARATKLALQEANTAKRATEPTRLEYHVEKRI